MRPVFATAVDLAKQLHFIELIITVGVSDPIKSLAFICLVGDHYIQAVERVEKALRLTDGRLDRRNLRLFSRPDGRHHHTIQFPVLIRHDQAALGIDRHRYPRALVGLGHGVEKVNAKIFQYLKLIGGRFSKRRRGDKTTKSNDSDHRWDKNACAACACRAY